MEINSIKKMKDVARQEGHDSLGLFNDPESMILLCKKYKKEFIKSKDFSFLMKWKECLEHLKDCNFTEDKFEADLIKKSFDTLCLEFKYLADNFLEEMKIFTRNTIMEKVPNPPGNEDEIKNSMSLAWTTSKKRVTDIYKDNTQKLKSFIFPEINFNQGK